MNFGRSVHRLGLGRLLMALYYRPIGRVRQSLREGGPFVQRETERQRQEMEAAAERLPALPRYPREIGPVHLMTGRRFWYQTVFCLHSLAHAAQATVHAELFDDGTIDSTCAARLGRLGPNIQIHTFAELHGRLNTFLPIAQFPTLRERWVNYPNIRKLIDVHAGRTGWKLVLDSDLLFFRPPDALLNWLRAPDRILRAVDCEESYGYSRALLEELSRAPLPRLLNVGVCGLRSDAIDWNQLERWTAELQRRERTNYYLEQALVAMMAVSQPEHALPAHDYLTFPNRHDVEHPSAVMHHYVATSKRWYFRSGWRNAVALFPSASGQSTRSAP